MQVKLADIIDGMTFQSDQGSSYLHTTTGEVVYVTTEELRAAEEDAPLEDFPEWQHDAIRIAGDIHTYGMTEAWYRYHDTALREIAIAWCEEHDIPYTA